jgi:large subunit ribosomal protein L24
MQRIKTGDTVEIISGNDGPKPGRPGKRGTVIRVSPKEERVVVEGVNIRKKHQRPQQAGRRQINAGIVEFEAPIHLSKVMLVCTQCGEKTRVGFRINDEGQKVRTCHKCNADID